MAKRKATTQKFAQIKQIEITFKMVNEMSIDELKANIRVYGKRAQSRIKSLTKSLPELSRKGLGGTAEMIIDRYRDYNVKTKGLSKAALRAKLYKAIELLNSKQSTKTGIQQLENKKYNTFIKNHPGLKGITVSQYQDYVKAMGKIQAAHEGLSYDSDADIYAAQKVVDEGEDIDYYAALKDPESLFETDDYWEAIDEIFGFNKL